MEQELTWSSDVTEKALLCFSDRLSVRECAPACGMRLLLPKDQAAAETFSVY